MSELLLSTTHTAKFRSEMIPVFPSVKQRIVCLCLSIFIRAWDYLKNLLAILQGNPDRPTPFFASVSTLAVLALPLIIALDRTFVLSIIELIT